MSVRVQRLGNLDRESLLHVIAQEVPADAIVDLTIDASMVPPVPAPAAPRARSRSRGSNRGAEPDTEVIEPDGGDEEGGGDDEPGGGGQPTQIIRIDPPPDR